MSMKQLIPALVLAFSASIATAAHAAPYVQVAAIDNYSAYYDGYYGTIIDGYWGRDGKFWYEDRGERWHSDDANHFQHDPASGLKRVEGAGGPRMH